MRTTIQTAAIAALVLTAAAAPSLRATPRATLTHWNLEHPFNFTDLVGKTDAARFPSEVDCERHFPNCDSPRFTTINEFFLAHNISSAQRQAAMQTEDPLDPTELSDAQVDAIVAADKPSFDQDAADNKAFSDQEAEGEDDVPRDDQRDSRHIKHIYRTLNAGFSLSEIHELFHDKHGVPIMLTNKEVDAAINAHSGSSVPYVTRS